MLPVGDDLDRIMAIMASAFDPTFGEAWTRAQVEGALLMGNCHYKLIAADGTQAENGAMAVGFALLRTICEEEELLLFAIVPNWRHRGLGKRLLEWVKTDARDRGIQRILLEMREGNAAEQLYRTQGFAVIGRRPNYYRGGNGDCIAAMTFACTLD